VSQVWPSREHVRPEEERLHAEELLTARCDVSCRDHQPTGKPPCSHPATSRLQRQAPHPTPVTRPNPNLNPNAIWRRRRGTQKHSSSGAVCALQRTTRRSDQTPLSGTRGILSRTRNSGSLCLRRAGPPLTAAMKPCLSHRQGIFLVESRRLWLLGEGSSEAVTGWPLRRQSRLTMTAQALSH